MDDSACYCPGCRKRVVQMGQDGLVKIRTSLVMFGKGATHGAVICRHCGSQVTLDIIMGSNLLKAIRSPRLVVRQSKNA
jgi:hypothetical protein